MSYHPPVPVRIIEQGDRRITSKYIGIGRAKLKKLDHALRGARLPAAYGKDTVSMIPAGSAGPFYYREGEVLIQVSVEINYKLSTVYIRTVPVKAKEKKEPCPCCGDCLMIASIASEVTVGNYENTVDIVVCAGGSYKGVFDVPIIDSNNTFQPGDRVIVYATPALSVVEQMEFTTDHAQAETSKRGYLWRVFNCMSDSDLREDGVDLRPVGIDNVQYTVSGNACATASVSSDEPDIEPPPLHFPVRYFVTSILAADCLEL